MCTLALGERTAAALAASALDGLPAAAAAAAAAALEAALVASFAFCANSIAICLAWWASSCARREWIKSEGLAPPRDADADAAVAVGEPSTAMGRDMGSAIDMDMDSGVGDEHGEGEKPAPTPKGDAAGDTDGGGDIAPPAADSGDSSEGCLLCWCACA